MAARLYSYRDVLAVELDALWLKSRDPEDAGEPELVLVGVGREALVVTQTHVYRLSSSTLPVAGGVERASVQLLAELTEAHVHEGLFLCRLRLSFEGGSQVHLRVRLYDRDKMRVAARMLSTLSLEAREAARAAAVARQAEAEAAASRAERTALRTVERAPQTRPSEADAAPAPTARLGGLVGGADAVELLRGLWQLVEVGAVSAAEYQAKKADLLGRM